MISKGCFYLLVCFVMVYPLTKGKGQENVHDCTPITPENANALALFKEAEGFSKISLADVFSDMNIALDTMAWSPDSTRLAVAGATFSMDETAPLTSSPQAYPIISAYRPDGIPLAFRGDEDVLEIVNGGTGELIHRLETGSDYSRDPTLSQDGRLLAFGDGNSQIQLWDLTSGERLRLLEWHNTPVDTLAFSPDGSLLASGTYIASPLLWDISTGTLLHDLGEIGVDNHVWDVEFSPDGTLLAISTHGSVALVDIEALPNESAAYLNDHVAASEVFSVAFNPDGTLLAIIVSFQGITHSYFVEVWDIATRIQLNGWNFDTPLHEVTFSPDGCFLAVAGNDDPSLKLWHVE